MKYVAYCETCETINAYGDNQTSLACLKCGEGHDLAVTSINPWPDLEGEELLDELAELIWPS